MGTRTAIETLQADPERFFGLVWPGFRLWTGQREILLSVRDNFATVVSSCQESGKDFIAARIVLWFYATRFPCKVICTSTSYGQMARALWGEVSASLRTAAVPLGIKRQHMALRRVDEQGALYAEDWVAMASVDQVENLMGTHLVGSEDDPRILVVIDESSGVEDDKFEVLEGQAHRLLSIGNPLKVAGWVADVVRAGDQKDEFRPGRLRRKVIRIDGRNTPNVAAGLAWEKGGRQGCCFSVLPGLLSYANYVHHLREWPEFKVRALLYGEIPEGLESEVVVPRAWLDTAAKLWLEIDQDRRADSVKYMGVDASHGRCDSACWAVVDHYGLVDLWSMDVRSMRDKGGCPQTAKMLARTKNMAAQYNIPWANVAVDMGGGGQEAIVDPLRLEGAVVRGVDFGQAPSKYRRKEYRNRRAELYGELAKEIDPSKWRKAAGQWDRCFSLPFERSSPRLRDELASLVDELSVIPKGFDGEGKMFLPPKRRKTGSKGGQCLVEMLGRSPDRSDALALAVWRMRTRSSRTLAVEGIAERYAEVADGFQAERTDLYRRYFAHY